MRPILHNSSEYCVGGDAHIAPANETDFTEISGEFATSQWGDVGIAPYAKTEKFQKSRKGVPWGHIKSSNICKNSLPGLNCTPFVRQYDILSNKWGGAMPKGVPNKRYTPEFKRMVVETMKKEHLSIYAAMQEFGINDHKIIERWERIYLEEGPEGLAIERRGRSSKGRPPKQLPKQVEEDLLAEVQRLRAENDYLKNLQALVLEDERRQHKKRW